MAINPITVPKKISDFAGDGALEDMKRIEQLLNALQNLRVQLTVNGSTQVVSTSIQFSGDAALIVLNL